LLKLEHVFNEYLTNEVKTNKSYAEEYRVLHQAIDRDGKKVGDGYHSSTFVLSFNYPGLIKTFFNRGEDGVFVNIHGKLSEEIIFGIDGKGYMDNSNTVSFTKRFGLCVEVIFVLISSLALQIA
jgi:hypothetical protein